MTYSILQSSQNSFTFAIRGGIALHETPRTQILRTHPNAYVKYSAKDALFTVFISDYAAGSGKTMEAAWAMALEVVQLDLLTHSMLTEVIQ